MPVSKQQRDDALIRLMNPLDEAKANDFSMLATYLEEQDARERERERRAFEAGRRLQPDGYFDQNEARTMLNGWAEHRTFEDYERSVEGGSSPSPDAAAEKAGR